MTRNPGLAVVPPRRGRPPHAIRDCGHAMAILTKRPLLFGNSRQIEAVQFIHLFERALAALSISDYRVVCWCCQGVGQFDCANTTCTQWHACGTCNGAGYLTPTRALMETYSRDQLRVIAEEVEELLGVTA